MGTRGSALALAQARWVAERISGDVELVEVVTSGDRGDPGGTQPTSSAGTGDKSRWVKELEVALLEERIDLAVHSAKDVPGELPDGLEIVAASPRADARDALVGVPSLDALGEGARVGTSSLRRRAQLLAVRPDVSVQDMRGNVDTRLRKLVDGECDALLLAAAGLDRLGLGERADARLDPDTFVPAPGQGVLALEGRSGDGRAGEAAGGVGDAEAAVCLRAERALAAGLSATCHTPVGAHAVTLACGTLFLEAFVGMPDGSSWVRDGLEGEGPDALGAAVAERMLAAGARDILEALA